MLSQILKDVIINMEVKQHLMVVIKLRDCMNGLEM
jgi:hypothetical protein